MMGLILQVCEQLQGVPDLWMAFVWCQSSETRPASAGALQVQLV